ncbi:MFS transporter [Streptomyces sp. NBC_00859]|uniref:MFS transporter n=1 Tax=Streptomyces sp. NBC_00859 TaxID=2903682 RepID=UPI00386E66C9|nr:MFS transporter [Streptomyces sp. NBC_00859]
MSGTQVRRGRGAGREPENSGSSGISGRSEEAERPEGADGSGAAGDDRPGDGRAAVFWRYWTASAISGTGDAVTSIALPLIAVGVLGADGFEVSLVTAAGFAAWILIGLPAGVLVQRWPLRGTQVAMDLVRAAAIASVPVAAAFGALRLPQLIVVALLVGLASVVFDVGNATFLPSVVAKEELTSRNSLTSGTQAVIQLGGPSLGGVLVQLCGAAATLVVDAVSYLASAALLRTLPRPGAHTGPAASQSGTSADAAPRMTALIREGWQYVTRHPVVGPCVAMATSVNFVCGGLTALVPVFLVRTLDAPAALVGVLIATEGVGGLVGAALTPRLAAAAGSARALLLACGFGACAALLMPLAGRGPGLLLFALGNAGFAGGVVVLSILTRTHRQTTTPPDLLPRVMATVRFVSWGAIPIGALTAGAVSSVWGNRGALWLVSGLAFVAPVVLLAGPLRRLRTLEDTR